MIQDKPTSIRLPKELMERLKSDAEKEKRSITKQIEYIVQSFYEIADMTNKKSRLP